MPSYMAKGLQCVGEAIARRWMTGPGQLIDDPTYGYNLMDLLNADLTPRDIAYAQQQLASEAQKDERVRSCIVKLTVDVQGNLSAEAQVITALGPFRMVLSVGALTPASLLVTT
jgi:hypothetical protein